MAIFILITIFGYAHRPCWQYPNIVNNSRHHVYSFSLDISWFSDYIYINYYIWKCAQTMPRVSHIVDNSLFFFFLIFFFKFSGYVFINYHIRKFTETMPAVSHIVNNSLFFFFLIFPDFLAIFALITILGNAHRPCKHYPSIVNNSICHVYSVSPIFPNFLAIFALITIFSNAHRPCSQCPNTITNNEHHP